MATFSSSASTEADSARHDHSNTQDSLRDLKNSISGAKEDLEDQLDQLRQTINTADVSLREILQADQVRLQSSLETLARAEQVANTIQPKVVIEHNRAGQGSRTIFGTDTSKPQFSLTVSDNEAGLGAVMGAGIHSPQTLQVLLGDSRTGDLALALQALQTQPPSTNVNALQSVLNNLAAERRQGITETLSEPNPPQSLTISEDTSSIAPPPAQKIVAVHDDSCVQDEALERHGN